VSAALRESAGATAPPIVQGAVLGGDPVVADYLFERLLAQGSRPALVALEISPETIAHPSDWVVGDAIRIFTWRDVVTWAPEILTRGKPGQVIAARFAPIDVYRRELLSWIVGRPPPYLWVAAPAKPAAVGATDGAQRPAVAPRRPNPATLSGVRQTRRWLRDYRLGGETRALERFLSRARAAGIPVVLVGVPVSSWVRALYTPEVEHVFRAYVDELGRRGAEFADYRAHMPDDAFSDHHHLNPRGADVFARVLASEVLARRLPAAGAASAR